MSKKHESFRDRDAAINEPDINLAGSGPTFRQHHDFMMAQLDYYDEVHGLKSQGDCPLIIDQAHVITLKQAVHLTGRCEKTIRRWCKEHKIARQAAPTAPLEISGPALLMILHKDLPTLELLLKGKKYHSNVLRYVIDWMINVRGRIT